MTKKLIKSGVYDSFTTFRVFEVNNRNNFVKALKKLIKSNLIISGETRYENEGSIDFNNQFMKLRERRLKLFRESKEKGKLQPREIRGDIFQTKDKPEVTIKPIQNGIAIDAENNLIDNLVASQEYELGRIANLYNYEKKYTGFNSHDFKNVFLLYPCKAYIGEKVLYISFFLMIYKNGLATLNSKINIDGRDLNELSDSIYDLSLENVFLPEFLFSESSNNNYKKKGRCNSLREVEGVYKKYLGDLFNTNNFSMPFNFITLIDYKNRPDECFSEDNISFNRSLYNLLNAPVSEFTEKHDKPVREFIKTRYFETSYFHRYYGNNNRIISVYTKRIKDEFNSIYPNGEGGELADSHIYLVSLTGVINVIEALLFRKFINDNYVLSNLNTKTSMSQLLKLKIKSKNDSLLDLKRYYYSYGSLTELQEFMHYKCEDYTKSAIANQWSREIEDLIKLKREQFVSTLSILGPIITIILTLILSFPTIKQISEEIGVEQNSIFIYIIFNTAFIFLLLIVFVKQFIELFLRLSVILSNLAKKLRAIFKKLKK
ncbi:hypothetical protein SAMN05216232_3918 [Virgibacillus subterraneus]|uniref:Uncharacterized protein n=1 Tax=Virgibacillus subterraneus TaxID=621109 RepID=A0A1H9KLN4_9BACI|nr:hypothetical protein [Virgibacillus subterraneus]SER00002.1 hypothetical protein SAMN05216232_3918 [Virgibacillus subterraneus]